MKNPKIALVLGLMIIGPLNQTADAKIGSAAFFNIPGKPCNIAYDPYRNRLYISNNSLNRIDVFDLISKTVETSISVGLQPRGLDIDGTGKYLYVCNFGSENISRVDLDSGTEVSRLPSPAFPTNVAISADGVGQIRVGEYGGDAYEGYNFNARAGGVGDQIENYWFDAVSANKQFLLRADYNWIKKYNASTGSWGPQAYIPGFQMDWWSWINTLAISNDGRWVMVANDPSTRILNENLQVYCTLNTGYEGIAIDPTNSIGYCIERNALNVIVLNLCSITEAVALPNRIYCNERFPVSSYQWTNLLLNFDGSELYELNSNGITIIPTNVP